WRRAPGGLNTQQGQRALQRHQGRAVISASGTPVSTVHSLKGMNTIRGSLLPALVVMAFSIAPQAAFAASAQGVPEVKDGWIRVPPAAIPVLAGFATLSNDCGAATTIVAGSSAAFDDVSIHETRFEDGMAKMRAIPKLAVPAGGST